MARGLIVGPHQRWSAQLRTLLPAFQIRFDGRQRSQHRSISDKRNYRLTRRAKQEHDVIIAGGPISGVFGWLSEVTELHGRRQFGLLLAPTFAAGQFQFSALSP
jgi:hypothetical protein